ARALTWKTPRSRPMILVRLLRWRRFEDDPIASCAAKAMFVTHAAMHNSASRTNESNSSSQPLESRSNRRLFDIWHIQIIICSRTRRDRRRRRRDSCPASRGSHAVSTPCRFLESTAAVDRRPQRIPATYRCRASTAPGVEYLSGLRLRYSSVAWPRVRPESTCRYRIPRGRSTRRQGGVGESPVVLSVRACQDHVHGRSFVSRVVDLADRCHPFRELPAGRHQRQERRFQQYQLPHSAGGID